MTIPELVAAHLEAVDKFGDEYREAGHDMSRPLGARLAAMKIAKAAVRASLAELLLAEHFDLCEAATVMTGWHGVRGTWPCSPEHPCDEAKAIKEAVND